jgi:hypothetical protein
MNSARPAGVLSLLCSERIAVAIGTVPVPDDMQQFIAAHGKGIKDGTVITVLTPMGGAFVWPCEGVA